MVLTSIRSRVDDDALKVLTEALQSGKVVVGFNRKENGLDVLVPIDLEVVKTEVSGDKVVRTRSGESRKLFTDCVVKVVEQAMPRPG